MMSLLNTLILRAVSILCAFAAFWLALHDKAAWPWFLVVAALTSFSIKFKD